MEPRSRGATRIKEGPLVTGVRLDPKVLANASATKLARKCARALSRTPDPEVAAGVSLIRDEYTRHCERLPAKVSSLAALYCHILCDLKGQGWSIGVNRGRIEVAAPVPEVDSPELRKAQVRAAHLVERDAQLLQPTTRRFIREMECSRLHGGSWHSLCSV